MKPSIDTIWQRISAHAGETFQQIRGGEFTYVGESSHIKPDRTNQQIPRGHFEEALGLVPLENAVPVQHLRGPSYIFAVLMDPRIRQGDW
jgi:hypothetical protein